MEIVSRRDGRILTDVLNTKLSAGSAIHSDEWRGYYNLLLFVPTCIQHNTVNHTCNFVGSATGALMMILRITGGGYDVTRQNIT